jgi:hypothetical protein
MRNIHDCRTGMIVSAKGFTDNHHSWAASLRKEGRLCCLIDENDLKAWQEAPDRMRAFGDIVTRAQTGGAIR